MRALWGGDDPPTARADMPFGSYHGSMDDAVNNAVRCGEARGGEEIVDLVHRLTSVGIPVMAHVQGRNVASAKKMVKTAKLLEQAGAFSMVLVWDDAMGTWLGHKAKFVRRFANLQNPRDLGVQSYASAVKDGSFPDPQRESYTIDPAEWMRFMEAMEKE
ncbi:Pyruvate/Phosphoenolpyruvate kinase-like domain-containing protein [Mycena galopus ATCC 62051]|nr:Pyruvate/Phosphoenolpyruvate kinase-like domain-containing protein [Mycena galopus ATCC 62051]